MAIFAGITSALAFSLLMFRVAIVYVDIAMAFVPQFIKGRHYNQNYSLTDGEFSYARHLSSSSTRGSYRSSRRGSDENSSSAAVSPSPYYPNGYDAPHQRSPLRRKSSHGLGSVRRRSRRSSQASISPTIASIREGSETIPPLPESGGLAPSVGIERDFEGVGGWRLNDSNDDGWENINSRLELPMERCSSFGSRYHSLSHRSHSVGPGSQSIEGQSNGWIGSTNVSRKGTLRNGSGNGTSGSAYGGGETQQASWNGKGTGGRANRSASGSISKTMTALTPSAGGKNHYQGNGPSPMEILEQEQGYFAGFSSQNGKWKPMV